MAIDPSPLNKIELTPIVVAGISSVFGLISGGVASLIAPWVNWGIEKRRKKLERRRELIDGARQLLQGKSLRREEYRQCTEYQAICPYLSQRIRDEVNRNHISGGEDNLRNDMARELGGLEKK